MLVAAHYNPGGRPSKNIDTLAADSRRVFRTHREKVDIVEQAKIWMGNSELTLSHAAEILHVSKSNLSRWMKELQVLKKKSKTAGIRLTSHTGRNSQLAAVHAELMHFVEEYRLMGFAISKKMLIFQASRLSDEESKFRKNTYGARLQAISRWMSSNGLVIQAGTHQAQEPPKLTMAAASDYISNMARPAVVSMSYRDKRYIINMDQMPVFFFHACNSYR